jgi:hypothetical protein
VLVATEHPLEVVDLSDQGISDWSHWRRIDEVTTNRKSDVRPLIGDLTKLGPRDLHTYENNVTAHSWSGRPAAKVEGTRSGVFIYGQNAGFQHRTAESGETPLQVPVADLPEPCKVKKTRMLNWLRRWWYRVSSNPSNVY